MKGKVANVELLILPDGRILTHNLTPTVAKVLRELNPDDPEMNQRAEKTKPDELPART
jgi:hypothetical protein